MVDLSDEFTPLHVRRKANRLSDKCSELSVRLLTLTFGIYFEQYFHFTIYQ